MIDFDYYYKISKDDENTLDLGDKDGLIPTFDNIEEAVYIYSTQYMNAACNISNFLAKNSNNHNYTDRITIPMLFFARHALELILKTIILKNYNKKESQHIINEHKHSLSKLADSITFKTIAEEEVYLLKEYLLSIDEIDENSSFFRYPFPKEFIENNNNTFWDNFEMIRVLLYYYLILEIEYNSKLSVEYDAQIKELKTSRDKNNQFIIKAPNGLNHMMIWENDSNHPSYNQNEGYITTMKLLYKIQKENKEWNMIFPMLFAGRNVIEIKTKDFIYDIMHDIKNEIEDSKRQTPSTKDFIYKRIYLGGHELNKNLQTHSIAVLEFLTDSHGWEKEEIDLFKLKINLINELDKNSDKFRYPINKGFTKFTYDFNTKKYLKVVEQIYEILDNCSCCLSDMADHISELKSYYSFYAE